MKPENKSINVRKIRNNKTFKKNNTNKQNKETNFKTF